LSDTVAGGEHRQNRLKEGTADDFNPALLDEVGNAVKVFGMLFGKPFDERTAGVQGKFEGIYPSKTSRKGR